MNKGLKSTKLTLQRIDQTTYVTFCYMFSHCVIYVEAEERRKHGFSVDSALHILVTHVGFPGEIQEDSLTLLLLFREEKSIAAAGLCRRRSKRKEDLNNPLPLPSGITHHYLHNTLSLVALCVHPMQFARNSKNF